MSRQKLATPHPPLQSISSWLRENTILLKSADIESARLDCLVILEAVLRQDRTWLLAHSDERLSQADAAKLTTFVAQRKERVPLAYITCSKEFYGRDFYVNNDVLVPRPESEVIIDMVKELVDRESLTMNRTLTSSINTVIDVGTGSGCLAITLKKELPDLHVAGIDISETALKVARKNARLLGAQIQWKLLNILTDSLPRMAKTRTYIAIANLPYVPEGLITSLEITKEPAIALFSGKDGLDHYRNFWSHIKNMPHKPIVVITESLNSQHTALSELAESAGYRLDETRDLIQRFLIR